MISVSAPEPALTDGAYPVPDDENRSSTRLFDALGTPSSPRLLGTVKAFKSTGWTRRTVATYRKGVTRFHGGIGRRFCCSGVLPRHASLCSRYVTVEGARRQIAGQRYRPDVLVSEYGVDALRYFLLRHVRTHTDGDFSASRLQAAINGELADQLGNLLRRIVSLRAQRHSGGISDLRTRKELSFDRPADWNDLAVKPLDSFQPHLGLDAIWNCFRAINHHLSDQAPWTVARAQDKQSRVQRIA